MCKTTDEAAKFKEEGNEAFKKCNYDEAIKLYSKSINLTTTECKELAIYYKNRAAAYIKIGNYEKALQDCEDSLKITPRDPKALFRRCQAFENLKRYEEAYRDATQIFKDDPTNKVIQPVLERLHKIVQERMQEQAKIGNKIDSMTKLCFDLTADREKREMAFNNLLVLSRERAGSELMIKLPIVQEIKRLLKVEKNREIFITGIRIIGELCKHDEHKAKTVLQTAGIPWFLEILDSKCEKQVNTAQWCMQVILNTLSGMDNKPDTRPKKDLIEKNKDTIDTLLKCLVFSINNPAISGLARDAIIELIMKNVHYTALSWAENLVEIGGVKKLMDCASELEEYQYESSMFITPSTKTIAAVCLARIYDNMYYDQAKEKFMQKIEDFIKEKLLTPDIESKVRVCVAITSLLRGPLDVGNSIIAKDGIMEMILVMANTEDELQQKVASECIIAAASKADKAKAIIAQGINILKKLYKSSNDGIRVRALVGLCKLGSSGGNDASVKPFAEGSTVKLAEACRRFLLHPGKDTDIRKWAAEGLSFLTLDAEVKEKLIEDKPALRSLIELAKSGDQSALYGVVTTLVNLCNAYEKQDVLPEMLELAKFAKQHIPEEHELDDPDFVQKRIIALGKENVTTALVALSKTESDNSRELMSRVFNSLCGERELRGLVVSQGGVKVLMNLALKGTDKGKRHASQALARIGITMNPEIAFPGQRALEVIRPLLNLLSQDCTALENFESLMALCNIAQMSESARQKILKEGGFSKIEFYMFEDHEYLCRAATQTICNLCMSEDALKMFEGDNDRVKFVISLCMDEDKDTAMAASGMCAILTGASKRCCEKVFDSKNWIDSLHALLANPTASLQYRGVCIVNNIITQSKECTEKLMETDIMEILMALTKLPEENKKQVVELAEDALKTAETWGVIKKPTEDDI
ncbi:unnamed protein product [Brassicogethes aeneus]|uniref:UNC-45/Cro1/She4 central domain-containing protein n=1 Tax=Brassicogethes aeneus TaxID=1431903 RepID=A0A9P0AUF2_BRAAE|nr:unnamed protein product [Brassicogethes aeneus]